MAIHRAALATCDAGQLVDERLRRDPPHGPVFLLALGKPAAAMASAAEAFLGPQLLGGTAVVPEGQSPPTGSSLRFQIGSHPIPDVRSASAGDALLAGASAMPKGVATVLILIAGGGSALAVAPAAGLSLKDKIAAHRALLGAGLPIQIVNGVRAHLSRIKGGGLLRALAGGTTSQPAGAAPPLPVRVEVLSDVGDGEIDPVASGPCSPDRTTFAQCLEAIEPAGRLPAAALRILEEGQRGLRSETLKPDDPLVQRAAYHRLAGPRDLRSAAVAAARARGLTVEWSEHPWQLSVAEAVERMSQWLAGPATARLFAAVGEVQLALPPTAGSGGRAQHLLLAMAPLLARHRAALLVAGSDGRDGNSSFAGAVAGSDLAARADREGQDIARALARFDSSSVISAMGLGLPATPPVSNLTDLVLLAREA